MTRDRGARDVTIYDEQLLCGSRCKSPELKVQQWTFTTNCYLVDDTTGAVLSFFLLGDDDGTSALLENAMADGSGAWLGAALRSGYRRPLAAGALPSSPRKSCRRTLTRILAPQSPHSAIPGTTGNPPCSPSISAAARCSSIPEKFCRFDAGFLPLRCAAHRYCRQLQEVHRMKKRSKKKARPAAPSPGHCPAGGAGPLQQPGPLDPRHRHPHRRTTPVRPRTMPPNRTPRLWAMPRATSS